MSLPTVVFLLVVFVVTAALAGFAVWLSYPDRFRQRLVDDRAHAAQAPGLAALMGRAAPALLHMLRPLAKLSLPETGWNHSPMRLRFLNAGWQRASAPVLFFGTKSLLAFAAPGMVLLASGTGLMKVASGALPVLLALAAVIGYYLPNAFLNHAIRRRQREIFEQFPDALDLLIICIEAGLSLDQALSRVANEIALTSRVLAKELQRVQIEMRSGLSREAALRHLALRTGVEDIDLLVAMLIQAERFGTSIGQSLRAHSDNLRTKRRQRAEEAAARIAVRLLMPLIFLIFPTLMLVLLGPAVIQITRVLLPAIGAY